MTWRVGSKVPRNLYRDDEPIAMLATPALAAELAGKLALVDRLVEEVRIANAAIQRGIYDSTQTMSLDEAQRFVERTAALLREVEATSAAES